MGLQMIAVCHGLLNAPYSSSDKGMKKAFSAMFGGGEVENGSGGGAVSNVSEMDNIPFESAFPSAVMKESGTCFGAVALSAVAVGGCGGLC